MRWLFVAPAALLSFAAGARADDFDVGKTVRIIIGTTTADEYGT